MSKWRDRVLVWICILVCLACWLVPSAWSAAVIQPVRLSLKGALYQTAAKVVIQRRAFGTVVAVDTVLNVDSLNRQYLLGTDTSWNILLKIFPNLTDSAIGWSFSRNLRTSTSSYLWNPSPYWNFLADSVVMRFYTSSASASTQTFRRVRYNAYNYDTTVTIQPVFEYDAYFDIYADGNVDPIPWHWSTRNDTTGSSGGGNLPTPGTPNQCAIFGLVRNLSGVAMRYATVTITLADNVRDSCAGGILYGRTITTQTNGNGYFGVDRVISVPKSLCIGNRPIKVTVKSTSSNEPAISKDYVIPNSATYEIQW